MLIKTGHDPPKLLSYISFFIRNAKTLLINVCQMYHIATAIFRLYGRMSVRHIKMTEESIHYVFSEKEIITSVLAKGT